MSLPLPSNRAPVEQGGGIIMRPVLHDILSTQVRASGKEVRFGIEVGRFEQGSSSVEVVFSDEPPSHCDPLVGADGIFSQARATLFPDAAAPRFTGQRCWRVAGKRPSDVDRPEIYFGGSANLGLNAVSQDETYMFTPEDVLDNPHFAKHELSLHVKSISAPIGGHSGALHEELTANVEINYCPLELLLLLNSWFKERVIIIGDAAHPTTPHVESGAGSGIGGWAHPRRGNDQDRRCGGGTKRIQTRRFERTHLVIEYPVRIGEIEMSSGGSREGSLR